MKSSLVVALAFAVSLTAASPYKRQDPLPRGAAPGQATREQVVARQQRRKATNPFAALLPRSTPVSCPPGQTQDSAGNCCQTSQYNSVSDLCCPGRNVPQAGTDACCGDVSCDNTCCDTEDVDSSGACCGATQHGQVVNGACCPAEYVQDGQCTCSNVLIYSNEIECGDPPVPVERRSPAPPIVSRHLSPEQVASLITNGGKVELDGETFFDEHFAQQHTRGKSGWIQRGQQNLMERSVAFLGPRILRRFTQPTDTLPLSKRFHVRAGDIPATIDLLLEDRSFEHVQYRGAQISRRVLSFVKDKFPRWENETVVARSAHDGL